MPADLSPLANEPRLLLEAALRPLQGSRFQPTGFPNLGHAEYESPDGIGRTVLVESAQSMANRMEAVCWDDVADDWVMPLRGLPFVRAVNETKEIKTNSVLEAHRINSEFIARAEGFEVILNRIGFQKGRPFDVRTQLVPALLEFDINSLLHGVFLEEVAGVIRLQRALSSFIEATGANVAASGGVKLSRVDPTLRGGDGNVPFPRTEWTAGRITAFFNLDLRQIRGYGLGADVERLLVLLALFKIQRFLREGLRLRTACDLDTIDDERKTHPTGFRIPALSEIEGELPELIERVGNDVGFRELTVTFKK